MVAVHNASVQSDQPVPYFLALTIATESRGDNITKSEWNAISGSAGKRKDRHTQFYNTYLRMKTSNEGWCWIVQKMGLTQAILTASNGSPARHFVSCCPRALTPPCPWHVLAWRCVCQQPIRVTLNVIALKSWISVVDHVRSTRVRSHYGGGRRARAKISHIFAK